MDLQSQIGSELWQELCNSYDAGDYKSAIVNAMHYLTKLIRDKTDLEFDGAKLATEALAGNN